MTDIIFLTTVLIMRQNKNTQNKPDQKQCNDSNKVNKPLCRQLWTFVSAALPIKPVDNIHMCIQLLSGLSVILCIKRK